MAYSFKGGSRGAFALDVLKGLGAPLSQANVLFLLGWMNGEGTAARYNPFATTLSMPGAGNFNSFGPGGQYHVRNYVSWAQGVQATVKTMQQGYVSGIVAGLKSGNPGSPAQYASALNTWGTGVFGTLSNLSYGSSQVGVSGSVGSSGAGGGGVSAPATPAQSTSPMEIRGILQGLGLPPNAFMGLIDQAVRGGWTSDELLGHLYNSKVFHEMFPGIFRKDGSLIMSPLEYRATADAISKSAADFGVKVSKDLLGLAIHNEKSIDEMGHIFQAFKAATGSEADRVAYNKILEGLGQKPIDQGEWLRRFINQPTGRTADLYETLSLQQAGVQGTPKELMAAAQQIGKPGEWVDLPGIVAEVHKQKDFVAPELHLAGIHDTDLAIMASGNDPKGQLPQLEQILRNRQALSGAGVRPQQGSPFGATEHAG